MPLELIRNDITVMRVGAIVNAANSRLQRGGGVCGAIFARPDGAALQAACDRIGHCSVGDAVITPSFGLPAPFVIHAVGPVWQGGGQREEELLRSAYTLSLDLARDRGLESILDTTFLSLFATPISAVFGMVIAFLIVRKKFSGKEILDFGSNLGGAVPGTIVGMGFILAFNFENRGMIYLLAVIGCFFYITCVSKEWKERILILVGGLALGLLCSCLDDGGPIHLLGEGIGLTALYYVMGAVLIAVGLFITLQQEYRGSGKFAIWAGIYLILNNLILYVSKPLRISGKRQQIRWLKVTLQQLADYLEVPFSLPTFFMGVCLFFITALVIYQYQGKLKGLLRVILLAIAAALAGAAVSFSGLLGFVGLIVPHIMRRLVGEETRLLLPAAALGGAVMLTGCDLLARLVIAPYELPVGVVLSLVGGPFFIWLLLRQRGGRLHD